MSGLKSPIFIVGAGRSGTTLLRSLLSAHSRLAVTPETHFMKLVRSPRGAPEDFEAFWKEYTASMRFQDLAVEPRRCLELLRERGERTYRNIFDAVLTAYLERLGKARVGEKTPGHLHYLEHLLDWYPEARVLVIRRDPRAVVASKLKNPWGTRRSKAPLAERGRLGGTRLFRTVKHSLEWVASYEQAAPRWLADPRVYLLSYESLVSSPEATLREICRFLDEPFESKMLQDRSEVVPGAAASAVDARLTAWREQHDRQSHRPVAAQSLEKWRRDLSAMEVAVVEDTCRRGMQMAGYSPTAAVHRLRLARGVRHLLPALAWTEGLLLSLIRRGRRVIKGWLGHDRRRETVRDYCARTGAGRIEVIHPEDVASNPLPVNFTSRDNLPADAGWWGYSFHDVPERRSGETVLATIPNCSVISYRDPAQQNDFYPAIITGPRHALDLREIRFRPPHAEALRRSGPGRRFRRATWIIERVYHNHSHWLTAHLPKLLLLKERGQLEDVLLPAERTAAMDDSMRMVGLEPADFQTFRTGELLVFEELTVVCTDRFRPELLRSVADAFGAVDAPEPTRRVYISRKRATRRRLVNEAELWPRLAEAGFEEVCMEDLSFRRQVELMRETAVLVAPHGAGLTNMLFCPPGAHVVEIADLSFPNPNFYALACGLGHRYSLVAARSLGKSHPLEKDLQVDLELVQRSLA